jgi:hypothetical protein
MKQDEKIGALWTKTSSHGDYMTGSLELDGQDGEKIQIVVFKNDGKTGNQPDWRILRAKPKDRPAPAFAQPVTVDDIPFALILALGLGLLTWACDSPLAPSRTPREKAPIIWDAGPSTPPIVGGGNY